MATAFRQNFSIPTSSTAANLKLWFPRHMYGGMKHMQARLRTVDAVVEVHDARIPFTGRNPLFAQNLYGSGAKPHILVLNKKDLIERSLYGKIERKLMQTEPSLRHVVWTNCKTWRRGETLDLLDKMKEALTSWPRYSREYRSEFNVMVIGVPNVGKSSLVNAVRSAKLDKGQGTPVGARPGVTMSIMNKICVCHEPKIFLIDTPGILAPSAKDLDGAMKLALCQTVLESTIGVSVIADYLLYYLNKRQDFRYVELFNLTSPMDDIFNVLIQIAKNRGLLIPANGTVKANVQAAAEFFLKGFRTGLLDKSQFLDYDLINEEDTKRKAAGSSH